MEIKYARQTDTRLGKVENWISRKLVQRLVHFQFSRFFVRSTIRESYRSCDVTIFP